MTGGSEQWTGKSMKEAHQNLLITDVLFDHFNSLCIQTLKEMRKVKIDGLKEMLKLLQNLRDNIVMKEDAVVLPLVIIPLQEIQPVIVNVAPPLIEVAPVAAIRIMPVIIEALPIIIEVPPAVKEKIAIAVELYQENVVEVIPVMVEVKNPSIEIVEPPVDP